MCPRRWARVKGNPDLTGQLDAALRFAGKGWRVFPCGARQKPLTPNGFKAATTVPGRFGHGGPVADASIGCPTGPDMGKGRWRGSWRGPPEARKPWPPWKPSMGRFRATVEQRTGSGGRQLFFRVAEGREVRNSARNSARASTWRGQGGYVILPPPAIRAAGGMPGPATACHWPMPPEWLLDLVAPLPKPGAPKAGTHEDAREGGRLWPGRIRT